MDRGMTNKQIKNTINLFLIRYFKIIVFSLFVIILALGYLFLIYPYYKKTVGEIETAKAGQDVKYSELQKYLSQLEELKAEYQKIDASDIEKIKNILPQETGHERLLVQLEDIVLRNGLLLTSLKVEEEEKKSASPMGRSMEVSEVDVVSGEENLPKEIKKIKISLDIVGVDYIGLKNILNAIENNLRLMDITNLTFQPKENKANLGFFAYYIEK